MKQKKQNRILAALLAVAMMFQMLPMMAFAAEGAGSEGAPSDVTLKSTGKSYSNLKDAVKDAKDTDTIQLGEGKYSLYGISSDGTTKGKDLTFVGRGHEKTVWYIGANAPDSGEDASVYAGDDSFDGVDKVTFQDMTLRTGDANYLGFKSTKNTVVKDCVLYGRTTYWGYQSAEFIGSVFNAPNHSYALWVYSSAKATFEGCTFNASGRVINIYNEGYTPTVDVYFNNCTVKSEGSGKAALNINDIKANKYTIHVTGNNDITATTDTISCSKIFGFSGKASNNTGHTDVYLNGELVWKNGEMQTHAYTDGERDKAYTIDSASEWENKGDHFEREVTKTCNYCKRQFPDVTEKGYQLSYDLHDGTGAADADYESKIYPEGEKATVAAAPALNGYRFVAWQDEADNRYPVGMELTLTANTTLTALWESVDKPEPDPGPGPSPDPDPEPGDDGSGAVIGVVIGGAAVIGGYELATRLYLKHLIGVVPSTRGELALLMWEHADKPEPKTAFTYSDIDEDDTDLQKAAQWCVENEYLHVRDNDNDRFHPNGWVPKLKVIQAWDKAFGLQAKANADK